MIPLIEAALVAVVVASYLDQRRERTAQKLAAQQEARLGEALEERISCAPRSWPRGGRRWPSQSPPQSRAP